MFPVVQELAADGVPVAVTCGVLNVSTLRYYEWRIRPASDRAWEEGHLMEESARSTRPLTAPTATAGYTPS